MTSEMQPMEDSKLAMGTYIIAISYMHVSIAIMWLPLV